MPVNIPNIGNNLEALMNGVKTGSNFYSGIMDPILKREQLKQQAELDREHQKQLENHFQMNFGLSKQAAARAAQAAADAHKKMDPMYEINQYQALENWIKGQAGQGGGGQILGTEQPSMPTQEMGEGMGMFSPEGIQQAQQHTTTAGGQMGGLNMELLKAHPMLRGFAKKHLGFDPLAAVPQTPEEKQAAALDLFKEKEQIKQASKSGNTATNKVLTQNQQAVQAIDTVLPMVEDFINHPENVYGPGDFSPSKKAAYNAKTGGMIDLLVAAQSLPQVKESVALVEDQIRRKTGEGTDAYIKRLKDFKKDLITRKAKAVSVVNSKKVDTTQSEDMSNMSDEELRAIAGGG